MVNRILQSALLSDLPTITGTFCTTEENCIDVSKAMMNAVTSHTPDNPINKSSHPSCACAETARSSNRMMTMIKASPPKDAVTPIIVSLASLMGMPQAALVELVALRLSATVQLPALHVATTV
jgi:hypothetical protein